ncbi:MAG: LysR family transcriptional regulator [Planctomycetota bacterium]
MEWLNFRHLYAFWMVARAGSFTRAAAQMYVAQSAVSAQVAALEGYFSEQLLVRGPRAVELTPAGRELLGYATSIFAHSRAINAHLRDKQAHERRSFRVGVVGGASRNFVFRLLEQYTRSAGGVHLSVSTGSYAELYELLRRFRLDAIVTLDPPKKKDMGEVSYRKLGASTLCAVAVPGLLAELGLRGAGQAQGKRARTKRKPPARSRAKKKTKKTTKKKKKTKPPAARAEGAGPVDVFKFRHPFEVDVVERYVQPLFDRPLELRLDTDDVPLLRFYANSGKGLTVLPRVGVLEDLESGAVEAVELTDCPEVNIYGISMRDAVPGEGDDGPLGLWASLPPI